MRKLLILFALMAILGLCFSFTSHGLIYKTIKTVNLPRFDFDSHSNIPEKQAIKTFRETASSDHKEIEVAFKVKAYSIYDYNNIFQTAPLNSGIRMELSAPSTLVLVIKANNPQGYIYYDLTRSLSLNQWHTIKLSISSADRVKVFLDNDLVVNDTEKLMNYEISDIAVGAGFSKSRHLDGQISDFYIKYTLFEKHAWVVMIGSFIKIMLFPIILALILITYVYISKRPADTRQKPGSLLKDIYVTIKNESGYASLLFSCVLSVSVLYVLYLTFFHYSSIIWSLNNKVVLLSDYTKWVKKYLCEQDGIELYVLYALTLLSILITFLLNILFHRINNKSIMRSFFILFSTASILFFANINFYPPVTEPARGLNATGLVMLVLVITISLSFLFNKYRNMVNILLPLLVVPICLVLSSGISFEDYNYIFTPALKLLHGVQTKNIYFQYDFFLPLLAALWLKSGLGIYSFRILGQISFLVLFTGIYFFAQKYFANKLYALFLLISLIIIRIYGQLYDPTAFFQVTPLRLDLWFILLLIAYWKGLRSWWLGLMIGILIIIHHNFGLIYAGSYLLLIATLWILEATKIPYNIKHATKTYFSLYRSNVSMLIVAQVIHMCLFSGKAPNNVDCLHAFLPISKSSFYWLVPIILSLIVTLVMKNRKLLSERYFNTSLFLIIFAAGNSLYFMGRSHENNLINISTIILFCLFLLFDLLDLEVRDNTSNGIGKYFMPAIATFFILSCAYYYSGRAMERVQSQYLYLKKWQFSETFPAPDMLPIQRMTRSSSKVIFLSYYDFWYYYYGGYAPQGNFQTYAWVMKKDLIDFLDQHLSEGYYVIMPDNEIQNFHEIIDGLKIRNSVNNSGFKFISKDLGQ